jgi:hypothetical protein
MSHDDFESVPGLPGALPAGEHVLWQGTPRWQALARHAFRLPWVSAYLVAMLVLKSAWLASDGESIAAITKSVLPSAALALIAVGVITMLAWLSANATIYTITNRRVAIRHGISVGLTLNLPFSAIESAGVQADRDGGGQIALALQEGTRIGYLLNWPHVRPGRFARPEPSLRALPRVAEAADGLATALKAAQSGAQAPAAPAATPARRAVRLPTTAAA